MIGSWGSKRYVDMSDLEVEVCILCNDGGGRRDADGSWYKRESDP